MNTLIAFLMFILPGANTYLTCMDAGASLPHSNADIVVFVVNNEEYPAILNEMADGFDSYSVEFQENGLTDGTYTFRQVIVDGEFVNISDPKVVTCKVENPEPSQPHKIFLPIIRG